MYFDQLGDNSLEKAHSNTHQESNKVLEVYQCADCLTIYDSALGDSTSNISANTKFSDLPESYLCSVCEAEKSQFEKVMV